MHDNGYQTRNTLLENVYRVLFIRDRVSDKMYQTKCIRYAVQVLSGIRHRVKVYAISAIRHQISCIRYPQLEGMFCVEKEGDASVHIM